MKKPIIASPDETMLPLCEAILLADKWLVVDITPKKQRRAVPLKKYLRYVPYDDNAQVMAHSYDRRDFLKIHPRALQMLDYLADCYDGRAIPAEYIECTLEYWKPASLHFGPKDLYIQSGGSGPRHVSDIGLIKYSPGKNITIVFEQHYLEPTHKGLMLSKNMESTVGHIIPHWLERNIPGWENKFATMDALGLNEKERVAFFFAECVHNEPSGLPAPTSSKAATTSPLPEVMVD